MFYLCNAIAWNILLIVDDRKKCKKKKKMFKTNLVYNLYEILI